MAEKCVHKGCGKVFTDPDEPCIYHPGPPEFHEGQKGWKCCKPRVLTFDEFLTIPPCTTGKHSTVDDAPLPETNKTVDEADALTAAPLPDQPIAEPPPRIPQAAAANSQQAPAAATAPESESDDPEIEVPTGRTCKRRGCDAVSGEASARDTQCIYHPGQALFHEGSKGWTCCKKRVLEFDEFMRIPGCKTRERHCFVGKPKKKKGAGSASGTATPVPNGQGGSALESGDADEDVERLSTVRNDFYQTGSTVHASFYLKKIDKERSRVVFLESGAEIDMSLRTADDKLYEAVVPLFASIIPDKSSFRILGTKLELTLAKADGSGWPVLRNDEKLTGEIIQTGRAGRA